MRPRRRPVPSSVSGPPPLSGLAPSTTFHYRIVASTALGCAAGEDRAFTTAALPAKPKVTISLGSDKKCLRSRSTSVTNAADIKRAIKVSKLPKRAYTLEVRVKTKDGRTVKPPKRYRTCSSH